MPAARYFAAFDGCCTQTAIGKKSGSVGGPWAHGAYGLCSWGAAISSAAAISVLMPSLRSRDQQLGVFHPEREVRQRPALLQKHEKEGAIAQHPPRLGIFVLSIEPGPEAHRGFQARSGLIEAELDPLFRLHDACQRDHRL